MNRRAGGLIAIYMATVLAACARSSPVPPTPRPITSPSSATPTTDDASLISIRKDPTLAAIDWRAHHLLGFDVFVSTKVTGEHAEALRVAARTHYEESGLFPILAPLEHLPQTAQDWADYAQPNEESDHAPFALSSFALERTKLLSSLPHAKLLRTELASATPFEQYDEGREYLTGEPPEELVLWLVRGRPWEAAVLFADAGVEGVPQAFELRGMLQRWHEQWGAEPVYVDGRFFAEMITTKQPTALTDLRAFAWEFYLTCPSDREAFDQESAPRLLGRLKKDRWVCWWFVE